MRVKYEKLCRWISKSFKQMDRNDLKVELRRVLMNMYFGL